MANQSQSSGDPSLCANNCGFFGNPATNNLCSKCYKDHLVKKSKELGDNLLSIDTLGDQKVDENKEEFGDQVSQEGIKDSIADGGESSISIASDNNNNNNPDNRPSNRCNLCKKRVGLTGFKCRCGQTFCSLHRYSDKHNCVFDYKGAGQDAISKANPVIKADKIDKI